MSRQPGDLRPGKPERAGGGSGTPTPERNWRWGAILLVSFVVLVIVITTLAGSSNSQSQTYGQFVQALNGKQVGSATVNSDSGHITYTDKTGAKYSVSGPKPTDTEVLQLQTDVPSSGLRFATTTTDVWGSILPWLLYGALFIGVLIWGSG